MGVFYALHYGYVKRRFEPTHIERHEDLSFRVFLIVSIKQKMLEAHLIEYPLNIL
jgi:hypothetical protein